MYRRNAVEVVQNGVSCRIDSPPSDWWFEAVTDADH